MIIGIFGESCTGKTLLANELSKKIKAEIYTGKDYIRLSKSETDARKIFVGILEKYISTEDTIVYVITEKEHLSLLPEGSLRVLVTAELDTIKERFAKRMNSSLSSGIIAMLERKHGVFDGEKYDLHINSGEKPVDAACDEILALCVNK